jgi:hypothetical protein
MQSAMRLFCWAGVEFQNALESVRGSGRKREWLVLVRPIVITGVQVGNAVGLAREPLTVLSDAKVDVMHGVQSCYFQSHGGLDGIII